MRRVAIAVGVILLAGLLAPAARAAEPVKIGVVDLQRCLNESRMGKKYKAEFTAEADRRKAELEKEEADLKALREEIEKQGLVLSETARAEKEREYKERLAGFKAKFQESQQALQRKDQELTRRILRDLQKVVQKLGETEGYTLILERQEGGVLFMPKAIDITDEVIRRYDEGLPAD
ncbi:MAG: OmpH family outer membrane protein [Deltaproteobacteria bacterium]|nr:OmpH family outer membrane protein [Deltaproteobacteria bacterium]